MVHCEGIIPDSIYLMEDTQYRPQVIQLQKRQLLSSICALLYYYFCRKTTMKYLLQPIPKSNPYEKTEPLNPYTLIEVKSTATQDIQNLSHQQFNNLLQQPALRLFCDSCKKQVTHQVHAITQDQQLCVGCMAAAQSCNSSYELVEKLDYPLFQPSWSAYQEVLLLDSLDKWGFGNWKDIQEYMQYFGAKFTQDQIETHYNTFYLSDKTYQPRFNNSLIEHKKEYQTCKNIVPNQVSIVSLTTNLHENEINYIFEQIDDFSHQPPITPIHSQQIAPKIKGYNSYRKEFETDYDEHAQKNIANLQFRDDDLPEQRQVKHKLIKQYNQRLKKRYQVHDFIIEHRLLDMEYQKEIEQTRTEYERQAAEELRGFMRFSSFHVHNQLVRRVALQKELKSIIEGMRSYRRVSNSGRLKQTFELMRRHTNQSCNNNNPNNNNQVSRSRGRPRKIIHLDNSEKSTASNSQSIGQQQTKRSMVEEQFIRRMKIDRNDLKWIVEEAENKRNGEGFRYKNVEVMVVERRG